MERPSVTAYALPDKKHWAMWCEYCRHWHFHAPEPGHRVAHCHAYDSPYYETGYILVKAEETPAWVLHDIDRKRPLGREKR